MGSESFAIPLEEYAPRKGRGGLSTKWTAEEHERLMAVTSAESEHGHKSWFQIQQEFFPGRTECALRSRYQQCLYGWVPKFSAAELEIAPNDPMLIDHNEKSIAPSDDFSPDSSDDDDEASINPSDDCSLGSSDAGRMTIYPSIDIKECQSAASDQLPYEPREDKRRALPKRSCRNRQHGEGLPHGELHKSSIDDNALEKLLNTISADDYMMIYKEASARDEEKGQARDVLRENARFKSRLEELELKLLQSMDQTSEGKERNQPQLTKESPVRHDGSSVDHLESRDSAEAILNAFKSVTANLNQISHCHWEEHKLGPAMEILKRVVDSAVAESAAKSPGSIEK